MSNENCAGGDYSLSEPQQSEEWGCCSNTNTLCWECQVKCRYHETCTHVSLSCDYYLFHLKAHDSSLRVCGESLKKYQMVTQGNLRLWMDLIVVLLWIFLCFSHRNKKAPKFFGINSIVGSNVNKLRSIPWWIIQEDVKECSSKLDSINLTNWKLLWHYRS